jgi:phosphoadenosine phosphosulfate reductase
MPQLIKNGALVDDRYTLLREAKSLADVPAGSAVIVPLALWQAEREELRTRGDVGVLLVPSDDPATLTGDIGSLNVIAIEFPQFTDGRGYSIARLLRERHGYTGELRAVGDILRDQLYLLAECGFDAFALRADRNAEDALAGLADFAGVYATTARSPQPWFRRRTGDAGNRAAPATPARRVEDTIARLRGIAERHANAVLAASFGAEDMVLIDLIARHSIPIGIFTLDTGRLPEETYALIDRTRERYGITVEIFAPDANRLQAFVRTHGVNAFYQSVPLREGCCEVRKTEPLKRALARRDAWITGIRREQSVTRRNVAFEEFDAVHALPKFNPLADWSEADVWAYIRGHNVPYNALHDRGYPSIGCAPCTRAIQPGEDVRAGRWWWEAPEHKECGLHPRASAKVPRDASTTETAGASS